MIAYFTDFVNTLNKPKHWLLLANIFFVLFLIILNNLGIIPLRMGDFAFFAILFLGFALYRPGWAFLFFIGTIPLENINLAPMELGISIRPYQFIGALTITAIIIRLLSGKLNFKLIKLNFVDYLVIVMMLAGFVSAIVAKIETQSIASLRLEIIFATFVFLYFLVRNYIQNSEDLKKVIPFFLSSSVIVVLYGIWQNIWFLRGLNSFETMPGRPNATFTEADWLGIFIILFISVSYVLIYRIMNYELRIKKIGLFLLLSSSFLLLILTVSRSAWLGVIATTIIFLLIIFTNLRINPKNLPAGEAGWQWKKTIQMKLIIIPAFIIAVLAVYIFHLTNFQLFNRVQSTTSGLQKITISCNVGNENFRSLPKEINNVSELEKYNCRHINLEEINSEKAQGKYVAEIYRKDPNVSIRSEIYQKSWQEVKNHWILGIGWGSIGKVLGQDERGISLNSSNIFLEVWLGSGVLGFASFLIVIAYILLRAIKNYYLSKDDSERIISLLLIVSWFGIIIANFFNAGIFLGFLWVWLGITNYEINTKYENTKSSE
ncbi:MAG TPA: O-antigen ligase family protein [Candidatus Moranbacteria bacterium]|nr:O-antigen ligase family protein [Candidatus Moranbacteria bacterium]